MSKPFLITFPKIGDSSLGYISIAEKNNLPFIPQRIYWTYYTPDSVERGGHAHIEVVQILIALAGKIIVNTEMPDGKIEVFILDNPDMGLYMPKLCWHTMQYSHSAVQICIASHVYDEKDYIRDYNDFKKF